MKILRKLTLVHWAIVAFILLDIAFVVLHFAIGQKINYFNIDLEKNLPTIYQGFKLVVVASIIAGIYVVNLLTKNGSKKERLLLAPYWFGFVYLALDELGQIHENFAGFISTFAGGATTQYREFFESIGFSSAQWLLFFIPIIIVALVYLAYLVRYFIKQKTSYVFILILAILCFAAVPVVEFLNTSEVSYSYSFDVRNALVALEEYLEMLGTSFFFAFNIMLLITNILQFRGSPVVPTNKKSYN